MRVCVCVLTLLERVCVCHICEMNKGFFFFFWLSRTYAHSLADEEKWGDFPGACACQVDAGVYDTVWLGPSAPPAPGRKHTHTDTHTHSVKEEHTDGGGN